ncbi:hypothetical protein LWE61_05225 [Sphingobium sufflavum]|uniref:hypothetical protein n=1 Tax=Sphingobium sufflavum TaxID=1129547 RepID=UPI001F394AC8|nr:hypothetical protein [Sphingobium sufflavum]MCE7795961.1 hypothetical protein [Sphingobium sufflavum]
MDALLLALLLNLMLDQGARTQHDIARISDSGRADGRFFTGLTIVIALNAALAAAVGGIMAALLMPNARLLFLAIALLFGAAGHILTAFRKPRNVNSPVFRGRLHLLLRLALHRAGENAAFVTAGVVAFTDAPVLAAVGAALGAGVALLPPLILGSRYTRHGLLRALLLLSGMILLCIAIGCAASALRIF